MDLTEAMDFSVVYVYHLPLLGVVKLLFSNSSTGFFSVLSPLSPPLLHTRIWINYFVQR